MTIEDRVRELSFERTVPRAIAHRRSLSEVFVTDSARAGEDEFVVAIHAPRSHGLWNDRRVRFHDPLVTVEASRQATSVVVHTYYGVPLDHKFILHDISFRVLDLEAYRDDAATPLEGVFRFSLSGQQHRGEDLTGVRFDAGLTIRESTALTMQGAIMFVPNGDYELLRAHARATKRLAEAERPAAEPISPATIGRGDVRNVLIAEPRELGAGELQFPLIVDQTHPSFFDHPQDHVPGPLVIEAYRQAATVAACRAGALGSPAVAMTSCETSFADFAEMDAAAECSAAVEERSGAGEVRVRVGLHQLGRELATGRIELQELSD